MRALALAGYLARRFLTLSLLFFGITWVSFLVVHLAPGGPAEARGLDFRMSSQAREKLNALYGLDKPVFERYALWAGRVLKLDFGDSFVDGEKAARKIARAVPVTLGINALSLFLVFCLGVPLGVIAATRKDTWLDRVISFLALLGFSVPAFWLALCLLSFFGVTLGLLPVSGVVSLSHDQMSALGKIGDIARHLALPVLVSSVTALFGVLRFIRSGMLEVLGQNYIRAAYSRGLPDRRVLYRHALKNALLPVVTILGLSLPGLLGGSVIFESIFSIPGMGRLFFYSVFARDYPVVMGILVLGSILTLLGNLLADLGYLFLDPRIRTGVLHD